MRGLRAIHALAFLGAVSSAAVVVGLVVLTVQMDRQQRDREISLVSSQIDVSLAEASRSAVTAATSDEGVRRLDHERDEKWARAAYVNPPTESLWIYTFDYRNAMISGGQPSNGHGSFQFDFERELPHRLAQLRRLTSSKTGQTRSRLYAGAAEPYWVGDKPYLLLVAPFTAAGAEIELIHDQPPLLVAVTPLGDFLKSNLEGDGLLDMTLLEGSQPSQDARKVLYSADGIPNTTIVWRPTSPGADLLEKILFPLLLLLSVFLALVAFAYRRGVLAARMLLKSEAGAHYLASHDQLTELANRRLFMQELKQSVGLARLGESRPAVLLIDLDGFKAVNDTYGHQCGDDLICEVGRRIKSACGSRDLCARLGGDEFVILAHDCCAADAIVLANRILEVLAGPAQLPAATVLIGASVGISLFRRQSCEGQLIREADLALYHVKDHSRGSFCLFEEQHGLTRCTLGAPQFERELVQQSAAKLCPDLVPGLAIVAPAAGGPGPVASAHQSSLRCAFARPAIQ